MAPRLHGSAPYNVLFIACPAQFIAPPPRALPHSQRSEPLQPAV